MATPLVMPVIGARNMSRVNKWIKSEGEQVAKDEILAELWTPDGILNYASPAAGTLLKIIVHEKVVTQSGSLLGVIGMPGEDLSTIIEPSSVDFNAYVLTGKKG
jgi:pyruvate dehydrogenase E2 component (dihydrolipoamide acetyltransferase)